MASKYKKCLKLAQRHADQHITKIERYTSKLKVKSTFSVILKKRFSTTLKGFFFRFLLIFKKYKKIKGNFQQICGDL